MPDSVIRFVRSRPLPDPHRLVVAYPWRHRDRAEALAHAVAGVLDSVPDVAGRVGAAAEFVRSAAPGEPPALRRPHVPEVA